MAEYGSIVHPTSGERFAVAMDPDRSRIIAAAGPMDYTDDFLDREVISGWLSNHSDTARDDAAWLTAELDRHGWRNITFA